MNFSTTWNNWIIRVVKIFQWTVELNFCTRRTVMHFIKKKIKNDFNPVTYWKVKSFQIKVENFKIFFFNVSNHPPCCRTLKSCFNILMMPLVRETNKSTFFCFRYKIDLFLSTCRKVSLIALYCLWWLSECCHEGQTYKS